MRIQGMTNAESDTWAEIYRFLRKQGYVTYAELFSHYKLNFYVPPGGNLFIAAVESGTNRILISPLVRDKKALSTFIRHELLHDYLKHEVRALKVFAKRTGLDYDMLDDMSINELREQIYDQNSPINRAFNTAADYEISNRGYTDADKEIVRHAGVFLGLGDTISGLVTEDGHPDWVNLPIEDMFTKLLDLEDKIADFLKQYMNENTVMGWLNDPNTFVGTDDNTVYVGW